MPPKEAIQQIRINSNPFAAQNSEPGFSRIEIITKPGTNSYHGSFRVDFNDSAFDARNAFAATKPPQQIKSYNGVFNGPIIRNHWDILAVSLFDRLSDEYASGCVPAPAEHEG